MFTVTQFSTLDFNKVLNMMKLIVLILVSIKVSICKNQKFTLISDSCGR